MHGRHRHNRGRRRVPHRVDVAFRCQHVVEGGIVAGVAGAGRDPIRLRAAVAGVAVDVVLGVALEVLDGDREIQVRRGRLRAEARRDDLVDARRVEAVADRLAPGRARLVELQRHGGCRLARGGDGHDRDGGRREVQGEAPRRLSEHRRGGVVLHGLGVDRRRALHELVVVRGAVDVVLGLHGEARDLDLEVLVDVVPVRHGVLEDRDGGGEVGIEPRAGPLRDGVGLAVGRPRLVELEGDRDGRLLR
mmetsp:Transcript_87997/g.275576  ORF Transcript_87997/g.275576 Transcript_87997/m.275576 type:complete len:248 (+) Transcript_87997:573-1316(+)